METLLQDVKYSFRTLIKSPGFTVVAIIVLALGIGANTAIFTVVNSVLLKPLAYTDPDKLVLISHHYPALKLHAPVSAPGFMDYKDEGDVFESAAVFGGWNVNLAGEGEPERIIGRRVTADYFSTLKVGALHGRLFNTEDDKPGNEQVVVLSHGLWQRKFGSDPNAVGKTLAANGLSYSVIGVLPADFEPNTSGEGVEIYAPIAFTPEQVSQQRRSEYLVMIARLNPGVTIEQAQAQMTSAGERVKQQNPGAYPSDWTVTVKSFNEQIVGDIRPHLLVLIGAVAFVLLIACANIANLLLARAAARQKEMAIRTALGASRLRLMRQLLTEALLLAIVGGGLGLLLALWGIDLLVSINRLNIPRADEIGINAPVVGFTLALSLLTGILFGLAPALQASKLNLNETLKEGGRGTAGSLRQRRVRSYLVISEIALALVLLVGAGLMIKSFMRLLDVDAGFRTENMLTMQVALPGTTYTQASQVRDFYSRTIEQIKAIPGVQSAGATSNLPLSGSVTSGSFAIEGRPPLRDGELAPHSDSRTITPDYFKAMAIPLRSGRYFDEQDTPDSKSVAIIDQTLAERYWPDEDPIGKRISNSRNSNGEQIWTEIVGVVGGVKHIALDGVVRGQLYMPHAQRSRSSMYFTIHTSDDPTKLVAAVKSAIQNVDKDQAVYNIKTMDEYLSASVARRRFSMLLFGIFGAVAMVLAAVGLYGVMSYAVTQRTHEIGVRMALGASRRNVLSMVVGQGLLLALIGVALGVGGAFALTRFMQDLLFGVGTTDLATFVVIPLILTGVALAACFVPARRATKVDPMIALRYE